MRIASSHTASPTPSAKPLEQDSWTNGWWDGAEHTPSPNFGPRPQHATIDLIVLHSISLPPGEYDNDAVHRLFTNTLDWEAHPYFETIRGLQVSSHYFISRAGRIWQFVSCDQRAWHAGQSTYRGRDNCNDDSIGIELEGLEGDLFAPAQYQSLRALCVAISKQYSIVHLAGHEHIAPGRKKDPGPGFLWSELNSWPEISNWHRPR
jgi:AmpD protein